MSMRPLTKVERELLQFAASVTMGVIRTSSSETANTAWKLSQRKLLKKHPPIGPFAGGDDMWSITDEGWTMAKQLGLEKVKKESVTISKTQLRLIIEDVIKQHE